MNEKLSEYDDIANEKTIKADYELLHAENTRLKKKLSTLAAIIDGIADDHEEVLCREALEKIIEVQTGTITDLKNFIAKKGADDLQTSTVLSLAAKNSMLCAALLNSIARNAELHSQLIKVIDAENQSIL